MENKWLVIVKVAYHNDYRQVITSYIPLATDFCMYSSLFISPGDSRS